MCQSAVFGAKSHPPPIATNGEEQIRSRARQSSARPSRLPPPGQPESVEVLHGRVRRQFGREIAVNSKPGKNGGDRTSGLESNS